MPRNRPAMQLSFEFKQFRITGYLSPPSSTACHWSKEFQVIPSLLPRCCHLFLVLILEYLRVCVEPWAGSPLCTQEAWDTHPNSSLLLPLSGGGGRPTVAWGCGAAANCGAVLLFGGSESNSAGSLSETHSLLYCRRRVFISSVTLLKKYRPRLYSRVKSLSLPPAAVRVREPAVYPKARFPAEDRQHRLWALYGPSRWSRWR